MKGGVAKRSTPYKIASCEAVAVSLRDDLK